MAGWWLESVKCEIECSVHILYTCAAGLVVVDVIEGVTYHASTGGVDVHALRARLSRTQYQDAIFQLADIWTSGVTPEEYSAFLWTLLDRVAKEYPFWNRTHADGPVRHLMIMPCDHGAAD